MTNLLDRVIEQREAAFALSLLWDEVATALTATGVTTPNERSIMRQTEQAAIDIIEQAGKPLPTADILARIERRVPVGGKRPIATLSARLSRAQHLTNGPGGWRVTH